MKKPISPLVGLGFAGKSKDYIDLPEVKCQIYIEPKKEIFQSGLVTQRPKNRDIKAPSQ